MFGVLLDKKQLEKYMEKLACDHNLKPESEEKTYPIPSLEKDFEYITMVYNLLIAFYLIKHQTCYSHS